MPVNMLISDVAVSMTVPRTEKLAVEDRLPFGRANEFVKSFKVNWTVGSAASTSQSGVVTDNAASGLRTEPCVHPLLSAEKEPVLPPGRTIIGLKLASGDDAKVTLRKLITPTPMTFSCPVIGAPEATITFPAVSTSSRVARTLFRAFSVA